MQIRELGGRARRWGVILAGGDGKRLLPLTRTITGDDRPKQFCALTGGETLLDQTRRRVSRLMAERQTFIVLTRTHERFYTTQLRDVPHSCLLVQPYNHGTAPAIAYSLTRLHDLDPEGVVAFFPSDHHFEDDAGFAEHIELAFAHAESDRGRVVLLGIAPEQAYGWIEPGAPLRSPADGRLFEVRRFWEKPSRARASRLMRRGCLWNSFVMVGGVGAFLKLMRQTLPSLVEALESKWLTVRGDREEETLHSLYAAIPATSFSHEVLSASPSALAVLRADALGWSDLGEPQRVFSVIGPQSEWRRQTLQASA